MGWGGERTPGVGRGRGVCEDGVGSNYDLLALLNRITETAEAMIVFSKYEQMVCLIKE